MRVRAVSALRCGGDGGSIENRVSLDMAALKKDISVSKRNFRVDATQPYVVAAYAGFSRVRTEHTWGLEGQMAE